MFGTSHIVFSVVPFGRVLKRCGWWGGFRSIFWKPYRPRHPNTIKYLLRRCVWTPKHLLKLLVKVVSKRELFVKHLEDFQWLGFSSLGRWRFFSSYLRAFWLPQKKVVSGLLTGLGWNMIKHWCRFIGWGCKKVWKLAKLGSGFVYW